MLGGMDNCPHDSCHANIYEEIKFLRRCLENKDFSKQEKVAIKLQLTELEFIYCKGKK